MEGRNFFTSSCMVFCVDISLRHDTHPRDALYSPRVEHNGLGFGACCYKNRITSSC